jgi:hypothetical protein
VELTVEEQSAEVVDLPQCAEDISHSRGEKYLLQTPAGTPVLGDRIRGKTQILIRTFGRRW